MKADVVANPDIMYSLDRFKSPKPIPTNIHKVGHEKDLMEAISMRNSVDPYDHRRGRGGLTKTHRKSDGGALSMASIIGDETSQSAMILKNNKMQNLGIDNAWSY